MPSTTSILQDVEPIIHIPEPTRFRHLTGRGNHRMLRPIMKTKFLVLFTLMGLFTGILPAQKPRGPSTPRTALEALDVARNKTRKEMTKLVAIIGSDGSPNPRGWSFLFHDAASPTSLGYLAPGEDLESADEAYGKGESPRYFDAARVSIDSPAAFEAANRQAAEAKIGFDRLNYELRGMEFTGEPIWTLRLLDAEENVVGIVHLSAETGKVKRTIWMRLTARKGARVIDSALAGGGPSAATESAGSATDEELKALPPVKNIEPPTLPPAPTPEAKPE